MTLPADKALHLAVRSLTGAGPQRERLYHAYRFFLRNLRPEDLPAGERDGFAAWRGTIEEGGDKLMAHLEGMTNERVDGLVRQVLRWAGVA
ncbi:MAG TPA: hypothetical protein VNT60_08045 [Deinococcales bacterium]|nr:hypothetical protein [Deinococcales bacterium]